VNTFYISFDTTAKGPCPENAAQYPKEITIVLQHQFWDLDIKEDGFEVGLSFAGVPERLTVPFAAIKGFFDPAVQFGLQFQEMAASANQGEEAVAESAGPERPKKERAAEQTQSPAALPLAPRPATRSRA
jgi:hypothetical protein